MSGAAKLAVGHPFDTVKVRLQVSNYGQFHGPIDCLRKTVRYEGISGLYKGVTPPLLGWMASDSIMLGSLATYRKLLLENAFDERSRYRVHSMTSSEVSEALPTVGHGLAGCLAGWTVSVLTCPIEQVKGRLQVQYAANKSDRFYSGPINCASKIVQSHGFLRLYHGLSASMLFRSFFFFWWASYDMITKKLQKDTRLSSPAVNFWAGGLSAQCFWLTAYPFDVLKQRIMTDSMGGSLGDGQPKYSNLRHAAGALYREGGLRAYWRGFVPCFLRAFPANGVALVAYEAYMRSVRG